MWTVCLKPHLEVAVRMRCPISCNLPASLMPHRNSPYAVLDGGPMQWCSGAVVQSYCSAKISYCRWPLTSYGYASWATAVGAGVIEREPVEPGSEIPPPRTDSLSDPRLPDIIVRPWHPDAHHPSISSGLIYKQM